MDLNHLIDAVSFYPRSLAPSNPWVGHIPFAAWFINEIKPRVFVELGTHSANSYFAFCQSIKDHQLDTRSYAIDTWQGDEHCGQYGEEIFEQVNLYNASHYAGFSRLLRMTFDDALDYFSDGSVDLLHIDGFHTYEAVTHDFETWLPKLSNNAVILFHDINVRERGFGVWRLWEELKEKYPIHLEFDHSHGLGVLPIGNCTPLNNKSDCNTIKRLFTALGQIQLERFDHLQNKQILEIKQQEIHHLNQILHIKQQEIDQSNQSSHIKQQEIEQLNQSLHIKQQEIEQLNQSLHIKQQEIDQLNQTSHVKQQEIDQFSSLLQNKIQNQQQQIAEQIDALQHKESIIKSLYTSKSWRITAPLRWMYKVLTLNQRMK